MRCQGSAVGNETYQVLQTVVSVNMLQSHIHVYCVGECVQTAELAMCCLCATSMYIVVILHVVV